MFARTLLLFAIVASTSAAFDTSCNAVKSSFSENVCAPGDAPYEHFDATSATEYHDLDDTTIDFIPCSSTTYAFETRNATATNKADAEATTGVEANIGDDECAHITIQTFDYFGSSALLQNNIRGLTATDAVARFSSKHILKQSE